MRYTFCTLALGEEYLESAIKFANDLNKVSNSHHMSIVTDLKVENFENTTFFDFPENHKKTTGNAFNYNLKFLPIKFASESDFEFVIFVDADWKIEKGYSDMNLNKVFQQMIDRNIDMFFERPHRVGDSKYEKDSFIRHKVPIYNLLNTNEFDDADVPNEQFFVFKNNEKLKNFVSYWETLNDKCVDKNCWAFAEGLEIGMSALKSGMNTSYIDWQHLLQNSFSFITKGGLYYERF